MSIENKFSQIKDKFFPIKNNRELYNDVGDKYWKQLVKEQPDLTDNSGVELALAVLRLLDFSEIRKVEDDPESFFKEWCKKYDLEFINAFQNKKNRNKSDPEEEMSEMKTIVGVAILISLVGGGILYLAKSRKSKKNNKTLTEPRTQPAHEPRVQPAHEPRVLVLAVHSGKIRSIGRNLERAGDLLADGQYWWLGKANEWPSKQKKMNLKEIHELPENNDAVLVVVYDINQSASGNPTSRPEASLWLRGLARQKLLRSKDMFVALQPSLLGNELRR